MDLKEKENLLRQFQEYLEEPDQELGYDPLVSSPATDLYTVFVELAALKNEVKIESRQFKEALDRFRGVIDPLQTGYDALKESISNQRTELEKARKAALRPLLLELLELRDRMAAGEEIANKKTGSFFGGLCKQENKRLQAMQEGTAMTARRLDQILAAYQVNPLLSIGEKLDPHRMRAVETQSNPDIPHGEVTGELRKGYLWEEELLRSAEVIVNK